MDVPTKSMTTAQRAPISLSRGHKLRTYLDNL